MQYPTISEHFAQAQRIIAEQKQRGRIEFPTGLDFLDNITGGMKRGEIWIISGKAGAGKTALTLQMARNFTDNPDNSILFLSLELKGWQLMLRMYCEMNGIDYSDLSNNRVDFDPNFVKIFEEYIKKIDFEIIERGYIFSEVEQIIKEYYETKPPDIIFLDFIQLVEWKNFQEERIALMEYIRKIKETANKTNIGFVIVSQLRRLPSGADYNRPPDLQDLMGSGCVYENTIVEGEKIKDIYKNKKYFPIKSYNKKTKKIEYIIPTKILNTQKLHCYRIRTKLGKSIIISKDTKLLKNGKWVKAKKIKLGDKIFVDKPSFILKNNGL